MTISRAQLLYGTDEPPAESRLLRTGPLTVEFSEGNLRAICWHGREAIRAVAYLVRDENWGTFAPVIEDIAIEEDEASFRVFYKAECRSAAGPVLRYETRIEGRADGHLSFDVTAQPQGDFRTNRCGFCVLHPILGVAGEWARIEHVDGSVEESRFPARIDPAQPFRDIREITHKVAPDVTAVCRMEGGTFEMEDQRNWTDASYKTYVRPLALPWPYTLPDGERERQTVTVSFAGSPQRADGAAENAPVAVSVGETGGPAPVFGLAVSPEEAGRVMEQLPRLRDMAPGHLVLHYSPLEGHGPEALRAFAEILRACPAEATLEFVLPCRGTPETELRAAAGDVAKAGLRLSSVAVSPAPDLKSTPPGSEWPECPPLDRVYSAAREAFPGLPLGGGMFSYFTELNRKRVPADLLDFIVHTTSPLVHAADDRSVMETLEALPFVTRSVRAIFGNKPYRIGPSSIGMRHNPYGARLFDNPGAERRMTMTAHDPRQKGLFAAAWMIGYAAAVADAALTHLALGELTGPFGAVGQNGIRPAFLAARALASLQGKALRAARSSNPSVVLALAAGDTLIVANLTSGRVDVQLPPCETIGVLDEDTALEVLASEVLTSRSASSSLTLGAYGIAVATLTGLQ